jgi:hypothetical protein
MSEKSRRKWDLPKEKLKIKIIGKTADYTTIRTIKQK